MNTRQWVGSEIMEDFDARQQRLLDHVLAQVRRYYAQFYETRECYRYPLNLSRLMKLCNRSGTVTLMTVRVLAFSYDTKKETEPPLHYERTPSRKNPMKRAYQIYLRSPHHRDPQPQRQSL